MRVNENDLLSVAQLLTTVTLLLTDPNIVRGMSDSQRAAARVIQNQANLIVYQVDSVRDIPLEQFLSMPLDMPLDQPKN